MKVATIALSVSEISQIVLIASTLQNLVEKIQTHAPDVWAEVQADFNTALNDWQNKAPADVVATVAASGQLPGMPTGSTDVQPAGPIVDSPLTTRVILASSEDPAKAPGATYGGADAIGVGQHIADHGDVN